MEQEMEVMVLWYRSTDAAIILASTYTPIAIELTKRREIDAPCVNDPCLKRFIKFTKTRAFKLQLEASLFAKHSYICVWVVMLGGFYCMSNQTIFFFVLMLNHYHMKHYWAHIRIICGHQYHKVIQAWLYKSSPKNSIEI